MSKQDEIAEAESELAYAKDVLDAYRRLTNRALRDHAAAYWKLKALRRLHELGKP